MKLKEYENIIQFIRSLEKRIYNSNDFEKYNKDGSVLHDIQKQDKRISEDKYRIDNGFIKIKSYISLSNDNKSNQILFDEILVLKQFTISKFEELKVSNINSIYLHTYYSYLLTQIESLNDTFIKIENVSETKPSIDYSDSKGTEKIIMLEKLGILEYLRTKEPFNLSINQLASAISGFTGINATTAQSYINPIISKDTDQKNNPLTSQKTVIKVEQKLLKIGFKPLN